MNINHSYSNYTNNLNDNFSKINTPSKKFTFSGNIQAKPSVNNPKQINKECPYYVNSFKYRIFYIEKKLFSVADSLNNHNKDILLLQNSENNIDEFVKSISSKLKQDLDNVIKSVLSSIKNQFDNQEKENEALEKEIIMLKNEKTKLESELFSTEGKITELEMRIGIDGTEDIKK